MRKTLGGCEDQGKDVTFLLSYNNLRVVMIQWGGRGREAGSGGKIKVFGLDSEVLGKSSGCDAWPLEWTGSNIRNLGLERIAFPKEQ